MNTTLIVFGAGCFGWLLPEFILILSASKCRIPNGMNWLSAIGAAAIAAGVLL